MHDRAISLVVALSIATACTTRRPVVVVPPAPAVESEPPKATIAAGTRLVATLDTPIDESSRVGDSFYATVTEPLVDERGVEVIPVGTKVTGRVRELRVASGGESEFVLEVEAINVDGTTRPVSARIVSIDQPANRRMVSGETALGLLASGALVGLMMLGGGSLKDRGGLASGAGAAARAPRTGLRPGTPLGVETAAPLQLPRP